MSTWFSKPNQSLISKVTKKRVGFNQYCWARVVYYINMRKDLVQEGPVVPNPDPKE